MRSAAQESSHEQCESKKNSSSEFASTCFFLTIFSRCRSSIVKPETSCGVVHVGVWIGMACFLGFLCGLQSPFFSCRNLVEVCGGGISSLNFFSVRSRDEAPLQMEVARVVFFWHQPKRWLKDQVVLIHELATRASCNSTAMDGDRTHQYPAAPNFWSRFIKFHEARLKHSRLEPALSWSLAKSCSFCATC